MSLSRIEIITSSNKLDILTEALNKFGISGMTITNVLGFGAQKGSYEYEIETRSTPQLLPKMLFTLFVADEDVDALLECIEKNLYTGHIGDGKIFVSDVKKIVRIRTGEENSNALS